VSFQVLTAAILLAGSPANTSDIGQQPPAVLIVPAIDVQDIPVPPQASPVLPAAPTAPAPPAPQPLPQPLSAANSADPQAAPADDIPDIVVTARKSAPGDPLARANEISFAATQAIDKAVIGPISLGYASVVPSPVRDGLGNFLSNLQEIDVFLNFMLQHKFGKAIETVGRFAINTTLGVGGLFDVAKRRPFNLPRRRNGFGDTMGFYGVKPGPYLFLPIIGATTVRDLLGRTLDRMVVPTTLGTPFNTSAYTIPTTVGTTLDTRADFDEQLRIFRASKSPYAARRDFYLMHRQAEIDHLRGKDRTTNVGVSSTPAPPKDPPAATPAAAPAL
jgi:phospholipid-binding lipoprotein MlaA